MKSRRIMTLLILSVISIVLLIYTWMDLYRLIRRIKTGTDIIGHADGPTRILVADPSYNLLLYVVTAVIIIITIALFLYYKRRKKL